MNPLHQHVVICGAGVIGAAVAYYLSLLGVAVTVVERSGVACAASGKAGGFLALDWCDHTPLGPLARKSFALHAQLPQALGMEYGYRRLTTLAVAVDARRHHRPGITPKTLDWLDGACVLQGRLGTPTTTAQVHPAQFTQALLQAAQQRGARLILGCVQGLAMTGKQVAGVYMDGQCLAATTVVIAMGPWSSTASHWLPLPPVSGLKGHSITLWPEQPIPAQALFVDYTTSAGERFELEVYPRPDGEVYLCSLSEAVPLPEMPEQVQPRPEAGALLPRMAATLSSAFQGLACQRVQACYRPITADGLPFLGSLPGVTGAYVATGHSCWGILNAPASGLAMAELIVDGRAHSVDLTPFDPRRALAGQVPVHA
jgi:glycine/D-amino acid oxidase-like deaminating enzyme